MNTQHLWIDFTATMHQRDKRIALDESQIKVDEGNLYGHTLVRGVAGSGKSLLLSKRVERIAKETKFKNILVLTYNRFMAGWLTDLVKINNYKIRIECSTFDTWASKHIYKYDYNDVKNIFMSKPFKESIMYDAILLDEAQDFKDEWFERLVTILNPNTNSLFIVYDNAQSLYGFPHRRKSDWSWKKLGINVVGRTDILNLNYRNSPEIFVSACSFLLPYIQGAKIPITNDNPGGIVFPYCLPARSSGINPLLIPETNVGLIAGYVKEALTIQKKSSIAIMIPPEYPIINQIKDTISWALKMNSIEHHVPKTSRERDGNVVTRPCVVIDSWKALKGVEFDAVILYGVDFMSKYIKAQDEFEQMAGLYSAMTRARDHLVMLYDERNQIVEDLSQAVSQAEAHIKICMSQPGPYIKGIE